MSKSFELLTCPIDTIEKNYEILSDTVSEQNGNVHGSPRGKELMGIGTYWYIMKFFQDRGKSNKEV